MVIFNIISGACSIIGLFVSLFVASKVLKLSNSNNNNSGEIQQGDGIQNIAKGKAALATNHSSAVYNDYTNSSIQGEIDQLPELTETKYSVDIQEYVKYNDGVDIDTCDLILPNSNTMCFNVDFTNISSKPEQNRWIGYSIKSMPLRDWRSFVNENYSLRFEYMGMGTITEIQIELTNKHSNQKIYQSVIKLANKNSAFVLRLNDYKDTIDDWKFVDEICFVFFPENCVGQKGSVFISDLSIRKD